MKSLSRVFNRPFKSSVKIDNSCDFPIKDTSAELGELDELIETIVKTCHTAFGGTWSVSTYKKKDGTTYTKHSINCMKCNRIQNNLYLGQTETAIPAYKVNKVSRYYGVSSSEISSKTQTPSSCKSEMRLTRYGYNISPTDRNVSESEPSPTSSEDKTLKDYKTSRNEKNISGQMSFKTHEKRRSGTSFYKKS
jgi:hypothetical protein